MRMGCNSEIKITSGKVFKILILLLLFLQTEASLFSQPVNIRPKIGLTLSGGGSNGIAHIGVLKVMEEAGLRPDYITGVSMGSIIGGMYSIGYSADSLHNILKHTDWDLSFTRIIPESKVIFPEKEHYNNSIISLPFSIKKVKLPSGLINGQQIENQLSYFAWPAAGINDFSKLPIPFMCLATDIISGKLVELRSGYLPDAIRASIAVPTIFSPIKIDTALLIDGGVIRNFAAEEVRNMGADIVIGSYTGFQVYNEDQLQSVTGIVKQIAFLKSREDFQKQKKITDILIEPDLKDFSSTVFTDIDSIVDRGYKAALPYKNSFRNIADSINRIVPGKAPEYILDRNELSFDKIEVTGNNVYSDKQILGILGIKTGEKIDKNFITDKIDLLYGTTWFDKVKYRILSRNDSMILNIDCNEESNAILYGGVCYDSYIRSGVVLRTTFKNLITRRSIIDFDSFIGQFFRFRLSMLQFIDKDQKIGFSTVLFTDKTNLPLLKIIDETGKINNYNFSAGFSVSRYLGLSHLMDLSFRIESSTFSPDFVTTSTLKNMTNHYLSASYEYQVNSLDRKYFPDKGTLFQLNAITSKLFAGSIRSENLKSSYRMENPGEFSFRRTYTFKGSIRSYFSTGDLTFSFRGDMLFTANQDTTTSLHNIYYLGGIESLSYRSVPLAGFHSNEIPADNFAGAGAGFDIEIFKDVHLSLLTNVFAVREINENRNISLLAGYGIIVGYNSIIGPINIGIMHGFSGIERYFNPVKGYVGIGYRF